MDNQDFSDSGRGVIRYGDGLGPFGKMIYQCQNILILATGFWMRTSDVDENLLPWFASLRHLHCRLTSEASTMVASTFHTPLKIRRQIKRPSRPVSASLYCSRSFLETEMAASHTSVYNVEDLGPKLFRTNNLPVRVLTVKRVESRFSRPSRMARRG